MSSKAHPRRRALGGLLLILGLLSALFLNLPNVKMNPGRELEYESVYKTYATTHVLLARPGSDRTWPDPKIKPLDHKNLGRGGSLDDPGIYLIPYLAVPLHISDPVLAIHWLMVILGIIALILLIPILTNQDSRLPKRRYLWLLVPGLVESWRIVPLASSWRATPANYSLVGELSLISLLAIWNLYKAKKIIMKLVFLSVLTLTAFLQILLRRSAGLEMECVGILLMLFIAWHEPRVEHPQISAKTKKGKVQSALSSSAPIFIVLFLFFFANVAGTVAVREARNSSEIHLSYASGISSHGFWGVIYTGLGWRPTKNGTELSSLGVVWSDTWIEAKLHKLSPGISADDPRREAVARDAVFQTIKAHPISFAFMIFEKFIFSLWLCKWWLLVIGYLFFANVIEGRRNAIKLLQRKSTSVRTKRVPGNLDKKVVQEKVGKKLIGPAVVVGGMVLLTADSLLGAPYIDYLTSLNSWICFWAIFLLRPIEKKDYTKSKHAVLR